MRTRVFVPALVLLLRTAATLAAQNPERTPLDPALIEALAPLLMAEDQRRFDSARFENALKHQNIKVRHTAIMAIGRVRDPRGTALLLPMLQDPQSSIIADAYFALGLLGDSAAIAPMIARLLLPDSLKSDAIAEAATAIATIGGKPGATALEALMAGRGGLSPARLTAFRVAALEEAWRLDSLAPLGALTTALGDRDVAIRYAAATSLGRLSRNMSATSASLIGQALLAGTRDKHQLVVQVAMKSLTRSFADSAGLPKASVLTELTRGLGDGRVGTRINALAAVGTWRDSSLVKRIEPLLSDANQNVQVQAAVTLGVIGGSAAAKALDNAYLRKGAVWALRRAALLAMVTADSALFAKRAGPWLKGNGTTDKVIDFHEKIVALEGWGALKVEDPFVFQQALNDPKPEVVAAALRAWQVHGAVDPLLLTAARDRLRHASFMVRDAAAGVLDNHATIGDVDGLLAAWQLGTASNTIDDRLQVIQVLAHMDATFPELRQMLSESGRSAIMQRPTEMLLRRQAAALWPEVLGQRWGAVYPVETGRSLEDYRGIVRTYVLAEENPKVVIELEGRQTIELELFAQEAPLTVANFLQLVDRRFFDANLWHRVVPNFVMQTGDPTGSGNGGSDRPIRDEVTRRHYDVSLVGMATSGPDTGTSQWFINLSPQPHLNARYTAFGQVSNFGRIGNSLETAFSRITQNDLIRTIKRVTN